MTMVILLVLGTIVGSFLNVVALRWDLPHKGGVNGGILTNFSGRSHCVSCGKTLNWFELVPIFSFFVLRARCRGCKTSISWQYPIVEIWTGLIFLSIYNLQLTILQSLLLGLVFCIYVVIVIYDFRHKIIPDGLVYAAILLSAASRFLSINSPLDWLAGPILFVFFGLIWLLSRGRAMGFGDAKLALSVGLLLGATGGFSAIMLSFIVGATISISYLAFAKTGFLKNNKGLTIKSEIPFAPYMIAGAWISLIFHLNIFYVSLF